MFTGIIEEIGKIESISKGKLSVKLKISAKKILSGTKIGDSISTNGVCLTVTEMDNSSITADVMIQTLKNTNLSTLKIGDKVNLERAMELGKRFGGHIVSGHIDGIGKIKSKTKIDIATKVTIETSKDILKYIIEKGSITIDGTSLTVAEVSEKDFSVFIIPHTAEETTLLDKSTNETVNLENDIIGKYVESLLSFEKPQENKKDINLEFLAENGFL